MKGGLKQTQDRQCISQCTESSAVVCPVECALACAELDELVYIRCLERAPAVASAGCMYLRRRRLEMLLCLPICMLLPTGAHGILISLLACMTPSKEKRGGLNKNTLDRGDCGPHASGTRAGKNIASHIPLISFYYSPSLSFSDKSEMAFTGKLALGVKRGALLRCVSCLWKHQLGTYGGTV